jgi:biopolymer transport protein ExbD
MGQSVGSGSGKGRSVNIELNIIPFIDLMSCVTAFLMVSAMWINIAQLDVKPAGHASGEPDCLGDDCEDARLSVLIDADEIWVGVSRGNDSQRIPRVSAGHDWAQLEDVLKHHKSTALFEHRTGIEIAADSTSAHPVPYQTLIAAMDIAVKAGFVDVGITEPQGLSVRPAL